jgi:hypothetical protein
MSTDRIVFFKLCHATEATKINKLHLKQVYIIMLKLAKRFDGFILNKKL